MRGNMEYIAAGGSPFFRKNDVEKTPEMKQTEAFFADIAQLGVYGGRKKWEECTGAYNSAMSNLETWKKAVNYEYL